MIVSTGDVPPDYDVINIVYSSGQDTISAALAELASLAKDRDADGIFAVRVVVEMRLGIWTSFEPAGANIWSNVRGTSKSEWTAYGTMAKKAGASPEPESTGRPVQLGMGISEAIRKGKKWEWLGGDPTKPFDEPP